MPAPANSPVSACVCSHAALTAAVAEDSSKLDSIMRIVKTVAGASVALWAAAAGAQLAEPLHVRNLNPLVSIFGLPAWDTVPIGTRFGATAEIANHYRFSL